MENSNVTSGLALISSYSDGEEDIEEEIQIKYEPRHEKSKSADPSMERLKSCSQRLPLPLSIVQLYKDTPDISGAPEDSPDQHDGRVRSFPHQRGNWSTYVYVPYTEEEGFPTLLYRLQECAARTGLDLKTVPEPHISLTRTVVLLHHWIDNFVTAVRTKLSHLPRFSVQLGAPGVYCNEERTRTFLGLRALTGVTELCVATRALDECLAEFRLPPFYTEASFHMSVLWVVGDARAILEPLLPTLQAEFEAHMTDYSHELRLDIDHCLCKSGNKSYTFPLTSL